MKRVFSNPFVALAAGLALRLLFVFRFPADSGDAVLYDQMAAYWLKNHVYAMLVAGRITPVDLRMPGYPAFLALIYAITGRVGPNARLPMMLAQTVVDLATCVLIAILAAVLWKMTRPQTPARRVFISALWLAALCPFTANYVAVPLTEVFAVFFTAAALIPLCLMAAQARNPGWRPVHPHWMLSVSYPRLAASAGFLTGLATLFRPESPLLLVSAWVVLAFLLFPRGDFKLWLTSVLITAFLCALPLVPWTIRNAITLREFQPLAPKNSNLPGELVPYGFMSWEKTWLYRFRDVYLVPWKLNGESINVDDIPVRAFDTPEEKARVAAILEQYNQDLMLSAEEDADFAQLARQRTARHPLRTYLWLPAARALTMWFTPRIELLPLSGEVFPLAQAWEDDKRDQLFTAAFFLPNIVYVALALWGAFRLSSATAAARAAVFLLVAFILIRTAFLTTLETPEPRYVLVCFPAVLALAAHAFSPRPAPDGWSREKFAETVP